MLARQIENGAPFDVYLSANEEFVSALAKSGHVLPTSVIVYATGRLALWSASGGVRSLQDLTQSKLQHIAIANPRHAPYGAAAEQTLQAAGLLPALRPKLVLAENVRQAYEFARSGNADAVLTSWTLLHDKGGLLIPAHLHSPLRQAGAVTRFSTRPGLAGRFLSFLTSPAGQRILQQYGLFPAR